MTQRELKERLYDITAEYFALLDKQGSIVWGKTKPVNPNSPMVTLTMSDTARPYRPMRRYIDGVPHDSYPSSTILRVDLFTKGAPTTDKENVMSRNENTAVNDLSDFANFLNSVYADHWCGRNGISLKARTVQDLTALINDISWQYRALLEIDVGFMQTSAGFTGTNFESGIEFDKYGNPVGPRPFEPNHSGGGTQEMADDFTGYFTQVEGPKDVSSQSAASLQAKSTKPGYKKEAKRYA